MRKWTLIAVGVLALMLAAGPAQAWYVDFTAMNPDPDNNNKVDFGWTDAASGFSFYGYNTALDPDHPQNLWWDSQDGFGVWGSGYEADEVEQPEALYIDFGRTLYITEVYLTDLFYEGPQGLEYYEIGLWGTDGVNWVQFAQDDINKTVDLSNGEYTLVVNAWLDGIWLTAPGATDTGNHEFSVAGLEAVPIPGAVWLLGSGLVGLAGLRRRNK